MLKKTLAAVLVALPGAALVALPAVAQTWPGKPVKFVVPSGPGGKIGRAHV